MRPEISVVVAVKNGAKYIFDTLTSILKQTFENWECIIVDDGSTDETKDIVLSFVKKDKRFKLIETSGGNGPFTAANIGIIASKGEFIARTDADDISLPSRLALQLAFLRKNMRINICGSQHLYLFENGEIKHNPITTNITFLKWQLIFRNRLVHSTMMFRKNWFEEIGLYPSKGLAQDWHIWLEGVHSDSLFVLDTPLVKWRMHDNSITKSLSSDQLNHAVEVSTHHIQKRLGFENYDSSFIAPIVSAIRGNQFLIDQYELDKYVSFLKVIFQNYKMSNGFSLSALNEYYFYTNILFSRTKKTNIKSIIKFLGTLIFSIPTTNWISGFFRLFFRILAQFFK